MISGENQEIRTRPCPDCCLCGTPGQLLYEGLEDRLFESHGRWNLKKCPSPGCGLAWMDPMPIEEDMGKAYRTYYTHERETFLRRVSRGLYRIFRVFFGIEQRWRRAHLMYLDRMPPGRLLEIGCGDGQRLALFKSCGWEVEGQEVDQKAAAQVFGRYGIKVHLGCIEHLSLREASYDAIIMNHVIEHVHDPVGLLIECRRLLRPGGVLVAKTPNIESRGHQVFRSCWRGLEPPRHLWIFSGNALRSCAEKAGFPLIDIWAEAVNAGGMYWMSHGIVIKEKQTTWPVVQSLSGLVRAAGFFFVELLLSRRQPWIGEELVLKAGK
ncbi:MAG TPA: class I SAM-dependent methyltransferase [Desulfomonilia bacterium]|nr:class I SAM-dependent methyltransferase [Desulfomonilia bacterium]